MFHTAGFTTIVGSVLLFLLLAPAAIWALYCGLGASGSLRSRVLTILSSFDMAALEGTRIGPVSASRLGTDAVVRDPLCSGRQGLDSMGSSNHCVQIAESCLHSNINGRILIGIEVSTRCTTHLEME